MTKIASKFRKNEKRRLISFEEDIIDEVYEKFGGKYSKRKIQDIFRASIVYIHNALDYTDCCTFKIPNLGYAYVNYGRLKIRKRKLDKLKENRRDYLTPEVRKEYDSTLSKIKLIEEHRENSKDPDKKYFCSPFTKNLVRQKYNRTRKIQFELLEDYQEKVFNREI